MRVASSGHRGCCGCSALVFLFATLPYLRPLRLCASACFVISRDAMRCRESPENRKERNHQHAQNQKLGAYRQARTDKRQQIGHRKTAKHD